MKGSEDVGENEVVTREETHLLSTLRRLLGLRSRRSTAARMGAPHRQVVQENRRMIRDCITRIRFVRAGVASPFLGLGQRESRRTGE
jgi:hypothetical protein